MTNPFDLGGYDNQNMGGFFSKIKKAVKKVGKAVEKTVKKVTPKPIMNAARKVKAEVLRSPIAQAGVMIAGSILIGPAAQALFGNVGSAVVSKTLTTAASAATKRGLTAAIQSGVANKQNAAANKELQKQIATTSAMTAAMAKDPDFIKIVVRMRGEGKTDSQIIDAWSKSQTATVAAQSQVVKTLLPQITVKLRADPSVPSKDVPALAQQLANQMAVNAVKQAQTTTATKVVNAVASDPVKVIAQPQQSLPVVPLIALAASLLM